MPLYAAVRLNFIVAAGVGGFHESLELMAKPKHGEVVRYIDVMRIPHSALPSATLLAVVQEFVTRDGTDHSSVEQRIVAVLRQLDTGRVELQFNDETQSCNIVVSGHRDHSAIDDAETPGMRNTTRK